MTFGSDSDVQFEELHRLQDEAIAAARRGEPPAPDGAGIVMVAGGGRCFTNAWVALTQLREVVGCTLPVQVWHLGPDELSPHMRRLLKRFDVELVDAFAVRRRQPMRRLGPWECKPYAVAHSPFRHVILLDADNVPLVDPALFLQTPEYAATGAIFWPDNQSHPPDAPVWDLFRVPYRDELEVESGQLVVDTVRHRVPLYLALHFNAWSDHYYRYIYGDKETFHFAWRQLGVPYARPEGRPRIVSCHKDTPQGRKRMTAALEQTDFAGRPAFHHRTGAEWMLFGDNPRTDEVALEARCHQALDALREVWDGRVCSDPASPGAGKGPAGDRMLLRRLGLDEHVITLVPDGAVDAEPAAGLEGWAWGHEQTCLILRESDGNASELVEGADGAWRGRQCWYPRVPVELLTLGEAPSMG